MQKILIAAFVAAVSVTAAVQPASACPAGYEAAWIQGNQVCKLKTPTLPLKTKSGHELTPKSGQFKAK